MQKLKDDAGSRYRVQVRRIIARERGVSNDEHRLYVYIGQGGAVSVEQAIQLRNSIPGSLTLDDAVERTIAVGEQDEHIRRLKIWLIAHPTEADTAKAALINETDLRTSGWARMKSHFISAYHDREHCRQRPVGAAQIGVYCAFAAQEIQLHGFEDMFVVDMVGASVFGIAWHFDRDRFFAGMGIMSSQQLEESRRELDDLWRAVASRE